jgi:CheY-like chemotaxis protein
MLATFLEDAGYTVVGAANGREALSYLYRCAKLPGLILLDVAMPVMTGWDFLRAQQDHAVFARHIFRSRSILINCSQLSGSITQ